MGSDLNNNLSFNMLMTVSFMFVEVEIARGYTELH